MYPHHHESIERVTNFFTQQPDVLALVLGGSLVHGFAQESSDVDIMIIVSSEEHQQRAARRDLQFFSRDLCTYPEGYVDGKYISPTFLDQVEQRGSEPARFAFKDSRILFSHIDGIEEQIERIARYPAGKAERIHRFHAQLQAWHWFMSEADKKRNDYLKGVASHKMILFGARMLLAHNELLYPYHKWLLAVLERAPHQPAGLMDAIHALSRQPALDHANRLYELIKAYREWKIDPMPWPNRFMIDSELTWMDGEAAVDDI